MAVGFEQLKIAQLYSIVLSQSWRSRIVPLINVTYREALVQLQLLSPSKLNLFLRVIRRRPDGYHELASLFQAIDLCDTLHFSVANHDNLSCNVPEIPTDESNLVLRATDLFRKRTGIDIFVNVYLEKKIPHQAGLGGGSGNAATTLWGLNELSGRPASLAELIEWSGEIGSDITFFLSEGTAYCTGRGEILRSVPPLFKETLWVVKPQVNLSTKAIFGQYDAKLVEQRDPEQCLQRFFDGNPYYFNDLESAAFAVDPLLKQLKSNLLQAGFHTVLMTGSGSAFFCLGEGTIPQLENSSVYKVNFLNREKDGWYEVI